MIGTEFSTFVEINIEKNIHNHFSLSLGLTVIS